MITKRVQQYCCENVFMIKFSWMGNGICRGAYLGSRGVMFCDRGKVQRPRDILGFGDVEVCLWQS